MMYDVLVGPPGGRGARYVMVEATTGDDAAEAAKSQAGSFDARVYHVHPTPQEKLISLGLFAPARPQPAPEFVAADLGGRRPTERNFAAEAVAESQRDPTLSVQHPSSYNPAARGAEEIAEDAEVSIPSDSPEPKRRGRPPKGA